ncbi:MAG: UDP-2,3-diacylglucosamine diphosphatase [Alphaproteobacteria bacterium]|nr:UDP-2,3-diacylglucosamine diphosphatase [Alphaproteobacteria bacterium]
MQKATRIVAEAAFRGRYAAPQAARAPRRKRGAAPPSSKLLPRGVRLHRTIFISDTHLGTRGCKAELLADFLKHNECETLYLVGDIFDGWQIKRWYWTPAQDQVVREVLRKIEHGTRVIYVPGNHDEFLRDYVGQTAFGVEVTREAIHETAGGLKLLVLHGDQFDGVIGCAKWLAHVGDRAYTLALQLNDGLHAARRWLGLPYWSLSAYLKRAVKNAVEYVSRYEEIVAREAARRGVDGVMCGHIHHAEIRRIGDILYLNDGDWVESCSALVEDAHGHLEILRWSQSAPQSDPAPAASGVQAAPLPA